MIITNINYAYALHDYPSPRVATMDSWHEQFIREGVSDGLTHDEIARNLQRSNPLISRGLSSRNIRRYCRQNAKLFVSNE